MDPFFIYVVCFGTGLVFTIISAIAGHAFGGGDHTGDVGTGGHADAGFEHTGMPGMSFFSPTVLASFVSALGGVTKPASLPQVTSTGLIPTHRFALCFAWPITNVIFGL